MPKAQPTPDVVSVPCRDWSGESCDYVAQADGNDYATAGKLINQVLALLSTHMGQKHSQGLDAASREQIRHSFGIDGWAGR